MADLPVDAAMRLEFKVDLKRVRHCERLTKAQEIQKEPHLRRSLILAYDIQELFRSSKATRISFLRSFGSRRYGFVSLSGLFLPFIILSYTEDVYKL